MTELRHRHEIASTIYFPPDLYQWLKGQLPAMPVGQRSLTKLVIHACQQYRTTLDLAREQDGNP